MTTLFSWALLYPYATGNPDILLFPILFAWQEECSAAPKAYGSDGEVSLLNALIGAFPDAIGLRCFIHMKNNIENHLQNKLGAAIIHDIFGHIIGDTKVRIRCSFVEMQ